jgi:hypothetical protein
MPASKAFPKGMKTFPMRIVAIIRLRKPVMAPEIDRLKPREAGNMVRLV